MLPAAQGQRRIASQKPDLITYQQLKIFNETNHHHHCRIRDAGKEHDLEEPHETIAMIIVIDCIPFLVSHCARGS
jgi:hypothetical protein